MKYLDEYHLVSAPCTQVVLMNKFAGIRWLGAADFRAEGVKRKF